MWQCVCVFLCIWICWDAAGGRLVLVAACVCVTDCFWSLFLRAKLPACSAGVLVEWTGHEVAFSVCLCVPFESGGWRMHAVVFIIGPPPPLCSHHCDKLEESDKSVLLSRPFMGWSWQSGRVLSYSKCPHWRDERKNTTAWASLSLSYKTQRITQTKSQQLLLVFCLQ